MKNNFKFLLVLLFFSCSKESISPATDTNILGKWNLETAEGSNGVIKESTYIIFLWYESGLEFIEDGSFQPRYGAPNNSEWFTIYDNSGNYKISDEILTLSYQEISYDYSIRFIDENRIEISNFNSTVKSVEGRWVLVRD